LKDVIKDDVARDIFVFENIDYLKYKFEKGLESSLNLDEFKDFVKKVVKIKEKESLEISEL
jgi:hypothetical protein